MVLFSNSNQFFMINVRKTRPVGENIVIKMDVVNFSLSIKSSLSPMYDTELLGTSVSLPYLNKL